jgi:hypothetical protein
MFESLGILLFSKTCVSMCVRVVRAEMCLRNVRSEANDFHSNALSHFLKLVYYKNSLL